MALNLSYCLLTAAALWCVGGVSCDVNVTDYMFWKKADIKAWNDFFPSRSLEEERRTMASGMVAVDSLLVNLKDSMFRTVSFQIKELGTAKELMAGTQAEGCVNGISNYIATAVDEAVAEYEDCAADAHSKLVRMNATWTRYRNTYNSTYDRALKGVDACWRTYPNRNQFDRLQSCVESMFNNYLKTAQATQAAMYPSPSMNYFENEVMPCLNNTAMEVLTNGKQFLDMLGSCAELAKGSINVPEYKNQLNAWNPPIINLLYQVISAQQWNYDQVNGVETVMTKYWTEQKSLMEQGATATRDLAHYQALVFEILGPYYNTLTSTALDNPGDASCIATARAALDVYAYTAANDSLSCDSEMESSIRQMVADVSGKFSEINGQMPGIGNAALLDCFSAGYIFAPDTILHCYNLTHTWFDIVYSDSYAAIKRDTDALYKYQSFFAGGDLPCDGSALARLLLAGEKLLYDLQRCLYADFGTTYDVTTPAPLTTSDSTITPTDTTTTPMPS